MAHMRIVTSRAPGVCADMNSMRNDKSKMHLRHAKHSETRHTEPPFELSKQVSVA